MSLEVQYDRFRNRDEGTWQKPLIILITKDGWSEHLTYVTDVVQPEESNGWKGLITHMHRHIRELIETEVILLLEFELWLGNRMKEFFNPIAGIIAP